MHQNPLFVCSIVCSTIVLITSNVAVAQQTDVTQTPNRENAGIRKSLPEQIGEGRGNASTPRTSSYIIARDPFRAIVRGQRLFQRKFTMSQGFGPRTQDGVGPIDLDGSLGAGLVDSCAGCHGRPRGAAGFGGVVFTRPDSRDAPHLFGLGLQEMLADEITEKLRAIRRRAVDLATFYRISITMDLVAKQIHYGRITAHPDGNVDTSQIKGVDFDLRVRPFFAEGSTISIREFVVGALHAEMGLESADPDLLVASQGGLVKTPAGMILDGSQDAIEPPPLVDDEEDGDGDGITNEIPTAIVDFLEFYLLNYFKPALYRQDAWTEVGRSLMAGIGCTQCHIPHLWLDRDRRVADVDTAFDPDRGVLNRMFAVAIPKFDLVDDLFGLPSRKVPEERSFLVQNIYTDFKRHDLGPGFHERNFDGTITTHFMTEPLWGVGTTAPYGHDGRSINLEEVILRHGGEAQVSRDAFAAMGFSGRRYILYFLNSLVLFGPPDTASNLDPGDPQTPSYPQRGHGSIDLSVLFNDPSNKE